MLFEINIQLLYKLVTNAFFQDGFTKKYFLLSI